MSKDLDIVLKALANLDAKGHTKEVDVLDAYLSKQAKRSTHKCGLEE